MNVWENWTRHDLTCAVLKFYENQQVLADFM